MKKSLITSGPEATSFAQASSNIIIIISKLNRGCSLKIYQNGVFKDCHGHLIGIR